MLCLLLLTLHVLCVLPQLQTHLLSSCIYVQSQDYHGLFAGKFTTKWLSSFYLTVRINPFINFVGHSIFTLNNACPKNFAHVCLFFLLYKLDNTYKNFIICYNILKEVTIKMITIYQYQLINLLV